jgi:hypothetical protein
MKIKFKIIKRILIYIVIIFIIYTLLSLIAFRGEFVTVHYYSYGTIEECKEKQTFISNDLKIIIEGDSLKEIKNLSKKFFTCKSTYEKYYGFFIHKNGEDKNYRRLQWTEPLETTSKMNWVIVKNNDYIGEAFYTGSLDEKIGDTVKIEVLNRKTDYKIGTIKIIIK